MYIYGMSRIAYYLFLLPLSRLPLPVLYSFSSVLYWIMYRLFGYRRKVVYQNLKNSFPEKKEREIAAIAHRFYRHFFDLIVETVRNLSAPYSEISRRFVVTNPEVLQPYYAEGRQVMLLTGHYNNWEVLVLGLPRQVRYHVVGIYKALQNKFMEEKMLAHRGRYGMELVYTKISTQWMEDHRNDPIGYYFMGDQSPTFSKHVYWTHFLHQETAVFTGAEWLCKKYNMALFYGHIEKVKRGHYTFTLDLLHEQPRETAPNYLTELHTRRLEQEITKEPAYWLWTHKRWKRRRKAEEPLHPPLTL